MPDSIKVMVIDEYAEERRMIVSTLSSIRDVLITGETDSAQKGLLLLEDLNPDIIIVGTYIKNSNVFDFSESVLSLYPYFPIIFVTSSTDEEVYRKAMRSGIKEVLKTPLDTALLSDSIYRAYDFRQKYTAARNTPQKNNDIFQKTAKIISVFSTKGGVGKTTISSNLAVALKQNNNKVALLDLDVYSADIALVMDIVPKRNVCDLVSDISKLDIDLLESYMFRHSSGVMVLPAPMKLEYASFLAPDHVSKILKVLVREYDYIVVDCASYMHDPVLVALDASDIIICVSNMDILSIKNLKSCITFLESMNYSKSKFRLVINRDTRESGIGHKDIEATIGLPVTIVLPQDDKVILESLNQGCPAYLSFKKSRFANCIADLAARLNMEAGA